MVKRTKTEWNEVMGETGKPPSDKEVKPKMTDTEHDAKFCPGCAALREQLAETKHKHDLEALEGKLKAPSFCQEHPDLCSNRAPLAAATKRAEDLAKDNEAKVAALASAQKTITELQGAHPELTEDFLTSQESCPNCGPHLKSYTQKKIDAALTAEKAKAEAEAKAKAEEAAKAAAAEAAKSKQVELPKRGYER